MESSRPSFRNRTESKATPLMSEVVVVDSERFYDDLSKVDSIIVDKLINGSTNTSDLRQAWSVRTFITESYIDSFKSDDGNSFLRSQAHFKIMVDKAGIFGAAGDTVRYIEELDIAEAFALSQDLESEAAFIEDSLNTLIDRLSSTPREIILKLRGTIHFHNRNFLRQLINNGIEYDDLVGTMYGMILANDGDPDEVLKQLGVVQ